MHTFMLISGARSRVVDRVVSGDHRQQGEEANADGSDNDTVVYAHYDWHGYIKDKNVGYYSQTRLLR